MKRLQLHVLVLKLVQHCLNAGCLCLHLTTSLLHHLTVSLTGRHVQLVRQYLLEIKTKAEGQTEPLSSMTAAYVCQTELKMKCVGDEVKFTILQSFVPESKKSKYFLIARDDSFIASFLNTCSSTFNNDRVRLQSRPQLR